MEDFSIEDINRFGDLRLKEILRSTIRDNVSIVPEINYQLEEKLISPEEYKIKLFSNVKPIIIEKLAAEMGIKNPESEEAQEEIIKKYPLEKLEAITNEIAQEEIEKLEK